MASKNSSTTKAQESEGLPFGTIKGEDGGSGEGSKKGSETTKRKKKASSSKASTKKRTSSKKASSKDKDASDSPAESKDESPTRKKATRRKAAGGAREKAEADTPPADSAGGSGEGSESKKPRRKRTSSGRGKAGGRGEADGASEDSRGESSGSAGKPQRSGAEGAAADAGSRQADRGGRAEGEDGGPRKREGRRRNRRGGRRRRGRDRDRDRDRDRPRQPQEAGQGGGGGQRQQKGAQLATGMFSLEKGDYGTLRREEAQWRPSKEDIYVPKRLIDREKLRDGALVTGRIGKGQKHKYQLHDVIEIDDRPAAEVKNKPVFKNLTSIDPDFHYAVGDITDNVSMRIVDLLCPIGRGQRGLIVAPPRSGKTTLLREFAHGIETGYPDVHLMVLLVDERPEEATEWRRSVDRAQVFVSTADETAKNHIQLAEAVWKRACRLVELGEDVVLLLDSVTRLARAYNNQAGAGGRTMSGGLDSRAMERPRKIFGSARNTETAGSLTILGTTLIETGSRLDQLVFEEFKGTGNMELVLSRRLADRRVFPAIDVGRSGTRKEEKLVGMRRLKLLHTLRRVLTRMNFVEAMELLITKLSDVEKTDDFLNRFSVDPEA